MTGESPGTSDQQKLSGETTPGEQDPRLAVRRESSADGSAEERTGQPTAVFGTKNRAEPAGRTPEQGQEQEPRSAAVPAPGAEDVRLRAAVATWVATAKSPEDADAGEGASRESESLEEPGSSDSPGPGRAAPRTASETGTGPAIGDPASSPAGGGQMTDGPGDDAEPGVGDDVTASGPPAGPSAGESDAGPAEAAKSVAAGGESAGAEGTPGARATAFTPGNSGTADEDAGSPDAGGSAGRDHGSARTGATTASTSGEAAAHDAPSGEAKPDDIRPSDDATSGGNATQGTEAAPDSASSADTKPGDHTAQGTDSTSGDAASSEAKPGATETDDAGPDAVKPGDTEPGDCKQGDNEQGDTEPGSAAPGDTEQGDSEPGSAAPGGSVKEDSSSGRAGGAAGKAASAASSASASAAERAEAGAEEAAAGAVRTAGESDNSSAGDGEPVPAPDDATASRRQAQDEEIHRGSAADGRRSGPSHTGTGGAAAGGTGPGKVSSRGPAPETSGEDDPSGPGRPSAAAETPAADGAQDKGAEVPDGDDSGRPPVDQPTTTFRALRRPAVDQPTTTLRLPKDRDPGTKPEAGGERPGSLFVPLRRDDKQPRSGSPAASSGTAPATSSGTAPASSSTAKPDAQAPSWAARPGPVSAAGTTVAPEAVVPGAERTRQQPLPPLPPLDLLAELTNTPPPPETPVRTTVRRVKIWTPLVLLLLIILGIVQIFRPLPATQLTSSVAPAFTFTGEKPSLPWPGEGQGQVSVAGLGPMDEFGEQKPVPIASVTKSMTAYIILRDHPMKVGANGASIPVDAKAEREGGNDVTDDESTLNTIKAGQKLSERDALSAMMIPSANNVARLLARWDAGSEAAFVKKMNATAKQLGMTQSTYTDPSGLLATTVSTAADQVKLGQELVKMPALMEITKLPSWTDPSGKVWRNYNTLVPYDHAIGIKTGSTTAAGGNLLFAAQLDVGGTDQYIVGAILDQNTPSIIDTVNAVSKKALRAAEKLLKSETVVKKGQVVGFVDDGLGGSTPVEATKDLKVAGWSSLKVSLRTSAEGTLPHSAKAGTVVGALSVGTGPGRITVPIALQRDMAAPGFTAKLTRF